MISMELSAVQYNGLQSAIIGAQVDEFLRRGGQITTTPPMKAAPLPYGRQKPIDPSTKLVRQAPKNTPGRTSRCHPPEVIERIESMAETMSCRAIAESVGLSYDQVKCIGARNGIVFRRPCRCAGASALPEAADVEADMRLIERIKAFAELGASRRRCFESIGIGAERFKRIVETYGIEYPMGASGKARPVSS